MLDRAREASLGGSYSNDNILHSEVWCSSKQDHVLVYYKTHEHQRAPWLLVGTNHGSLGSNGEQ